MLKRIFVLFCLFVSVSNAGFAQGKKVSKIVLDAGHGGKDVGAVGRISQEKELTLAVVLRLGKILKDSLKDVEVIYTRTSDYYPTLVERHEIANKNKGDLFISVHVNATAGTRTRVITGYKKVKRGSKTIKQPIYKTVHKKETSASGTETYVLGLHRNSQKEGAIEEHGDHIVQEPGLLNVDDPQTAIIIAQYSQAFLSRSVSLGSKIQENFASQGRRDAGVKQMGLEVLAGSAMPGVLVEIGFINNPEEEIYLNSEAGQHEVAMAIYRGIKAYKQEAER